MNKWIFVFLMLAVAKLPAQANTPVRLAIVSETDETKVAAAVLTAQLSSNGRIQLLERDQIEKVYHEQGLSAANRDDLKLGRILGADGLLLLNVVRTPQSTNLMTRLIAVKPGVVLTDGSFPWPLKNTPEWAESVATYINSFLPKLTVLAKDVIPISVVNLRAAISSAGEKETERDLKLLTIQRLSQEQRLFVLERQKMQLLSNEKELKSDESAFWDGSYLLDGIADQNGYSKDTVTINARLTPPKGGAPLSFEVSGSRTNLSQVVNRLAAKVVALLRVHSTVPEWSAASEAAQYYDEAKWALRWGVYPEAQAAADSAWALGTRNVDCAIVRVKAYVLGVTANVVHYEVGQDSFDCTNGYDSNDQPLGPPVSKAVVEARIKHIADEHPYGMRSKTTFRAPQKMWVFDYAYANKPPDPKNLECALHALALYYQFSRNSSGDLLKVASATSNWKNSAWYDLGIQDLVGASKVLRDFNFVSKAQKPVADELADLRALARSVAQWISQTPTVRESYFVGSQLATHDELDNTMIQNPNIFRCEVNWGCYWQVNPEDEIALYRQLMNSPVFCYIHRDFWIRELTQPRLVAWNEVDQKAIPAIWKSFFRQLGASTNVLLRLEAKALEFANAPAGPPMAVTFTNLFNCVFAHKEALINNNVEVLYLDWGLGDLVDTTTSRDGIATETGDALDHLYYSKYSQKLDALDQEYWNKTVPSLKFLSTFQKQIRYLKNNTPYDFFKFADLFNGIGGNNYSKSQAREILPLIISYRSNLVAQSQSASRMQKGKLMGAIAQAGFLEDDVNRILHPPTPKPKVATNQRKNPPAVKQAKAAPTIPEAPEAIPTNILLVNHFIKIPYHRLQETEVSEAQIIEQNWSAGKLLVSLLYGKTVYKFDKWGNWKSTSTKPLLTISIFDPNTKNWDMVNYPNVSESDEIGLEMQNDNHRMILFHGNLFCSEEKRLQTFDFQKRQWHNLDIPDQDGYDLFNAGGHLFATDNNSILEVTDGGKRARILASIRRRPARSALDSLENLGSPEIFSGPNETIYANVGKKIFRWNGKDWREALTLNISQPPEIFGNAVILRSSASWDSDYRANLWIWNENKTTPELALSDQLKPPPGVFIPPRKASMKTMAVRPLWKSPTAKYLTQSTVTFFRSNLYFFADHCIVTNISGHWTVAERNGYYAQLVCLSPGLPESLVLPLKFDLQKGQPPLASLGKKIGTGLPWETHPTWMAFVGNSLYIGQRKCLGIWAIPISELTSAIKVQKQIQRVRLASERKKALAAEEQHRKVLKQQWQGVLAKYDLNHNDRIDPDEKEAALADPVYIKFELGAIDTNHNDRLDAQELAWFDADHNGILDPPEEAGIAAAQKLLAAKLIKDFDRNGDGQLDQNEFVAMLARNSITGMPGNPPWLEFSMYDRNHDHELDARELQSYLERHTMQDVWGKIFQTDPQQMRVLMRPPRPSFKQVVEIYWHGLDQSPLHPLPFDQTNQARPNPPPQ